MNLNLIFCLLSVRLCIDLHMFFPYFHVNFYEFETPLPRIFSGMVGTYPWAWIWGEMGVNKVSWRGFNGLVSGGGSGYHRCQGHSVNVSASIGIGAAVSISISVSASAIVIVSTSVSVSIGVSIKFNLPLLM